MKPIKGLHKDLRPEDQPDGTYFFGKNGLQHDRMGSVTNEPGFQKIMGNTLPFGHVINGILETDTDKVIVFSTNGTTSAVQLINLTTKSAEYTFNDTTETYKLGFKPDYYITGAVQRNYKGDIVCAFTDKNTFPKFLNFGDPETSTLNSWNLFPQFEEPTIAKTVMPGGFIDVGSHYIALRYYKTDGTVTAFTKVSSGVVITSDDGTDVADKAIELKISDQDLSYDYMEVAIISKIKGVTSAQLMDKLPVTGGTYTITYTGDNTTTDITIEEILTPQVHYDRCDTMTQLNDALYIGKLHNDLDMLDLQPYANLINMKWKSELLDMEDIPEEHKSGQKKSMKHGEVYAIYVRYRANGRYSPWYTIPAVDLPASMLNGSVPGTNGGLAAPMFKLEDTVTAFSPVGKYGITGPYKNDTELYPNNDLFDSSSLGGRDLRGQGVLHHKMPSVKFCKENLYATETEYGTKKLDILGLQAENIVLPAKYQGVIDGYEIGYAKRTIQNMTVYSQGLLLHGVLDTAVTNDSEFHSTGHNWNVQTNEISQENLRFHGLDILLNKPAIKPSHISTQLRIEVDTTTIYTPWSYPTGGSASDGKGCSVHKSDVHKDGEAFALGTTDNLNKISEPRYVEVNSKVDDYNNQYMETVFEGKLSGAPLPVVNAPVDIVPLTSPIATVPVETHLTELCDIKSDVYNSFYAQEIVSAGDVIPIADTKTVWGGDIFLSIYTFHTYGIMDNTWDLVYDDNGKYAVPADRTRRIVHRVLCETVANHYARYEDTGDIYSKWFDNNTLDQSNGQDGNAYPLDYTSKLDPNSIQIVKGAEGINDFVIPHIYSPYRDYLVDFPYRVHRGGKLDRQNNIRSWRTFLALDYYECQKDKGFIVNLEGMEDRLLIHHENALFATRDKAKLESGLLGVTIGSGDIFELEPQEVQASKLGYGGTQHDLACIRTPIGYIFPDAKQGEIFLYVGGQLKKMNPGMNNFLRKYLPNFGKNPFVGNGITIGWDHEYKRVLTSSKRVVPTDDVLGGATPLNIDEPSDINALTTGDIVFINGKYMRYLGVNPGESDTQCTPTVGSDLCPGPSNLAIAIDGGTLTLTGTWSHPTGYTPDYEWQIFADNSNTIVASGLVASTDPLQAVFTPLTPNELYRLEVRSVCSLGNHSNWSKVYGSHIVVADPPPPDPPEILTGYVHIKGNNVPFTGVGPVGTQVKITIGSAPFSWGTISQVFVNQFNNTMSGAVNVNIPGPLPTVATVIIEIQGLFPNPNPGPFPPPSIPATWGNLNGITGVVSTSGLSFGFDQKVTFTNVPINQAFLGFLTMTY